MSAAPLTSSASSVLPAAREGAADGFFAYHGAWAPGVRLFRRLRFSAKALIISLAFTLPFLLVLGWQQVSTYDGAMQAAWTPPGSTWKWRMAWSPGRTRRRPAAS
jgi:methyl-accepting chemotaxis protein